MYYYSTGKAQAKSYKAHKQMHCYNTSSNSLHPIQVKHRNAMHWMQKALLAKNCPVKYSWRLTPQCTELLQTTFFCKTMLTMCCVVVFGDTRSKLQCNEMQHWHWNMSLWLQIFISFEEQQQQQQQNTFHHRIKHSYCLHDLCILLLLIIILFQTLGW